MRTRRRCMMIGAAIVAVLVAIAVGGNFWLTRPVEGKACTALPRPAAVDFTSAFNPTNRLANGIMIRPERGQIPLDCVQILSSFRRDAMGPALIEVQYGTHLTWFDVPKGHL
jgi:hypothetical protein